MPFNCHFLSRVVVGGRANAHPTGFRAPTHTARADKQQQMNKRRGGFASTATGCRPVSLAAHSMHNNGGKLTAFLVPGAFLSDNKCCSLPISVPESRPCTMLVLCVLLCSCLAFPRMCYSHSLARAAAFVVHSSHVKQQTSTFVPSNLQ